MNNRFKILFIFLFLLLFFSQGIRNLYETTEVRYAEASRELLVTGKYLIPQLNFKPHFTKPPFTYWMIAIFLAIGGKNSFFPDFLYNLKHYDFLAFWVRTPYTLFFFLSGYFFYKLCFYLLKDRKKSFISLIVFLTSFFTLTSSLIVSTDLFLLFWCVFSLYSFFAWICEKKIGYLFLFYIGLGFGFLTKGPIIWLIVIPSVITYFILFPEYFKNLKNDIFINIMGLFIALFISFFWFFYLDFTGIKPFSYYVNVEFEKRIFSNIHHRQNTWLLFWVIILFGTFPYIFFYRFRNFDLNKLNLWLLLSFSIPFSIFCISKSRLPLYMLPLFIFVSIFVANNFLNYLSFQKLYKISFAWLIVFFCSYFLFSFTAKPSKKNKRPYTFIVKDILKDKTLILVDGYYPSFSFYLWLNKPVVVKDWTNKYYESLNDFFKKEKKNWNKYVIFLSDSVEKVKKRFLYLDLYKIYFANDKCVVLVP